MSTKRPGAYKGDAQALHPADPGIALYISRLRARYAAHDLPLEETRRLVDESMAGTRLTDVLYAMRREDD